MCKLKYDPDDSEFYIAVCGEMQNQAFGPILDKIQGIGYEALVALAPHLEYRFLDQFDFFMAKAMYEADPSDEEMLHILRGTVTQTLNWMLLLAHSVLPDAVASALNSAS